MFRLIVFLTFIIQMPMIAHANLRDGLVGWWMLEEGAGTSAFDSSGQGNTQTLTLTPTWATNCARGKCLDFDGVYAHTEVNQPAVLNLTTITVSAWVKVTSSSSNGFIAGGICSGGCASGYGILMSSGKAAMQTDATGCGNTGGSTDGATTLTLSKWYNVVGTYDGANRQLFLNGVSDVAPTAGNVPGNPSHFSIGAKRCTGFTNNVDAPFAGSIDDVRVYNRVLTDQEIADLYKSGVVMRNAVIRNAHINK